MQLRILRELCAIFFASFAVIAAALNLPKIEPVRLALRAVLGLWAGL